MKGSQQIEALLGFAIKSGRIVFGTDNILQYRKRMYLILFDQNLSENAKKKLAALAEIRNIPLFAVPIPLAGMLHKDGVKAIAMTDGNMAKEVMKYQQ